MALLPHLGLEELVQTNVLMFTPVLTGTFPFTARVQISDRMLENLWHYDLPQIASESAGRQVKRKAYKLQDKSYSMSGDPYLTCASSQTFF